MEITKKPETSKTKEAEVQKIAVVQIRGLVGIRKDIKDTLFMLRLRKKHACSILTKTPVIMGMLKKANDYITYGEASKDLLNQLEKSKVRRKDFDTVRVYFLKPPVGGFERKGIKAPYTTGGVLGYRKEKIADLLKKMM